MASLSLPPSSSVHPLGRSGLPRGLAAAFLLWASLGGNASANRAGPPVGRANDPPTNIHCATAPCHTGALQATVVIELLDFFTAAPFTEYIPGATHDLQVVVTSAFGSRWGFELIPLTGVTMAGTFPAAINVNYQVLNGAPPRRYAMHTLLGTAGGQTGGNTWTIRWAAPATDIGPITFYVCANAANDSNTSAGDRINCMTFVVQPPVVALDTDGDTILDADERAQGTFPDDAESDDDGVRDGDEQVGDSDMDGIIDALECDSDGDGLPDGLEVGIDMPDRDTDLNAGCFIADDDPLSMTDPTNPNTDGDGDLANPCNDGDEDANRNGRVDLPGETDPENSTDCPVAGPTSHMRWSRANTLFPIANRAHFATLPGCTGLGDIVICAEAPGLGGVDDPVLPRRVLGAPGVLLFIQYDSALANPGTVDVIFVAKDPASPGDVLVSQ